MSGKIEISRELAERIASALRGVEKLGLTLPCAQEIRDLIAAPVVERQPLSVWGGAMPESNGKSNFTVILHTGDLTEGICVYRSEYPDRARYEADCFRHLIGDPAFPEKPFICDYDTDKHSGYVKPDTSPVADDLVRLLTRARIYARGEFGDEIDACLAGRAAPVAVPDGWKLVPINPTSSMLEAGKDERMDCFTNPSLSVEGALIRIYSAIIEAAPNCLDKVKELNQ